VSHNQAATVRPVGDFLNPDGVPLWVGNPTLGAAASPLVAGRADVLLLAFGTKLADRADLDIWCIKSPVISGFGTLLTRLNKSAVKIFKEVSMGGRFGKYGDVKRRAQIRQNEPGRKNHV
jgi:hypothetical protein